MWFLDAKRCVIYISSIIQISLGFLYKRGNLKNEAVYQLKLVYL